MTQRASLAALATGLWLATGQVGAVTLTFENLAAGTVLSNQYAALGAIFTANAFSGPGTSTSGEPWATNTDMTIVASAGTEVGGLGLPGLVSGNILHSATGWLNENGDASFRITFSGLATGFSATFAGVSTGTDVSLFAYNGTTLLGTVSGTGNSTSTSQFVLSYAGPVTSIAIRPGSFDDWVGVDNITYTLAAVPEASTVAMMGIGVLLLALVRRRSS
jgi:PEP-CTERM motif